MAVDRASTEERLRRREAWYRLCLVVLVLGLFAAAAEVWLCLPAERDMDARLVRAVRAGDMRQAEALLLLGADPNGVITEADPWWWYLEGDRRGSVTPVLGEAIMREHADMVRLLLRRGADPNALCQADAPLSLFGVRTRDRPISMLGLAWYQGRADLIAALRAAGAEGELLPLSVGSPHD